MADQNQNEADVVTIKEAVDKVKKWAEEKDYEKVKEGSQEILEVEPDNEEIKKLLSEAETALGGASEVAEAPKVEAQTEEAIAAEPALTPESTPAESFEVQTPSMPEPEVKPEEAQADEGMPDFSKKEEEKPDEEAEKTTEVAMEPKKSGGMVGKIVLVVILLAILAGLVYAYLQGWFNPALEYVLGLLGL
jgi:cobalamin biosynthesis Mg chelatase CobN